ncbi:MAG: NADPH dehydrogenase NamA [Deltaproteobacteria bacterium]|nr:NADPH dehydrogenase NamA [Deltaproteobacteria bacterium]
MSKLFTPIVLREVEIKNRVVMPPMCQYSAATDGMANDWHLAHYVSRAIGGAGLIIMEATAVEARGRITDYDLGIWHDEHIPMLRRIVDNVHRHGAKIGIQAAHAGRKATAGEVTPVAPSPIPFSPDYKTPEELTAPQIKRIVEMFREGAKRAQAAEFDLLEIHGAHGYLINEFLSPAANRRTDGYGSTPKARMRLLKEVIAAVRDVWPEGKPLSVRISAVDHIPGAVELKDTIEIVNNLKDTGVDIWHISSGGIGEEGVGSIYPGYQVPYSERIKSSTGVKTIAVGGITTCELAEEIIANKRADMVALGRELLRNPYWPLYAAKKLGYDMAWPKQYEMAKI